MNVKNSYVLVLMSALIFAMEEDTPYEKDKNHTSLVNAITQGDPEATALQKELLYAQQRYIAFNYNYRPDLDTPSTLKIQQYHIDEEARIDLITAQNEGRITVWDHPDASDTICKAIEEHNKYINSIS